MNHQQERGIAPIWIILSIIVAGIVALFIYGVVNRPPNRHIGDGKAWNEKMSQGSADAKNVFVDYTDYFCSFCAEVEAPTNADYFDKGIGVKNVAVPQKIPTLPLEYFLTSAKNIGLDESKFSDCMTKKTHQKEIADNTQKALSLGVNGLPYMVINDYQTSGFAGGESGLRTILKLNNQHYFS